MEHNATPVKKVRANRGRRSGAQTDSASDLSAVIDVVVRIEPVGYQQRGVVSKGHNEWAVEHDRSERDAEALRIRFD